MLKKTFINLLLKYTDNASLIDELWAEIESNYSGKKRYYHNLSHLENLLAQLIKVKDQIKQWDTILFTLYYHDAVYKAIKSNNEEASAILADKRMKQISVPTEIINSCKAQILATKKHQENSDTDTNYFTDVDLSVLGQDWERYSQYYQQVRKEYSIYPDIMYNPGRKKVLQHFLDMNRIFKTEFFYSAFENQAKQNLKKELSLL